MKLQTENNQTPSHRVNGDLHRMPIMKYNIDPNLEIRRRPQSSPLVAQLNLVEGASHHKHPVGLVSVRFKIRLSLPRQ